MGSVILQNDGSENIFVYIDNLNEVENYRLERVDLNQNTTLTFNNVAGQWEVYQAEEPAKYSISGTQDAFVDKKVACGIYSYRAYNQATDELFFVFSKPVKVGFNKYGHTFNNYRAPCDGSWGEILTVDDLVHNELWGIDLIATNGAVFEESQIAFIIKANFVQLQADLKFYIEHKQIISFSTQKTLGDKSYDYIDKNYSFKRSAGGAAYRVQLNRKPVTKVNRFDVVHQDRVILDILKTQNWQIDDETSGVLWWEARTDLLTPYNMGSYPNSGLPALLPMPRRNSLNIAGAYAIDYDVGYASVHDVPEEYLLPFQKLVSLKSAIDLLNRVGDGLMAGFSSSSLSMDGMSESFSSTQSATSAYFGARIAQYTKQFNTELEAFKTKLAGLRIAFI